MEKIKGYDSEGNLLYEDDLQVEGTSLREGFVEGLKDTFESLEEDVDNPQIDNPTHYQSFNTQIPIDCITAMRAAFGDEAVAIFCRLNAFKYNWRAESKGGKTDIAKAIWYLNKYLELTDD